MTLLARKLTDRHETVSSDPENSCQENSTFLPVSGGTCGPEDLVIDDSVVSSSIVVDLGFVCDNARARSITNALYMLGMLIGSYLFGWLSDTYGRLNALMASVVTVSVAGVLGYVGQTETPVTVFSQGLLWRSLGSCGLRNPQGHHRHGRHRVLHGLLRLGG